MPLVIGFFMCVSWAHGLAVGTFFPPPDWAFSSSGVVAVTRGGVVFFTGVLVGSVVMQATTAGLVADHVTQVAGLMRSVVASQATKPTCSQCAVVTDQISQVCAGCLSGLVPDQQAPDVDVVSEFLR
eukprot:694614-Amphidinium_carterae.1